MCSAPRMSLSRLHLSERRHSGRPSGMSLSVGPFLRIFFCFFFPTSSLNYPISGHYILWREGVKYGDITISDLTHHNGIGVFNDLDYTTTPHSRKFDRHGSTAFVAMDLIDRKGIVAAERQYRHGLESLFWIFLWISSCYEDDQRTIPTYRRCWLSRDIAESACFRYAILSWPEHVPRTRSYWLLAGPIFLLRRYWSDYLFEQRGNKKLLCIKHHYNPSAPIDPESTEESAEDVERMLFTFCAPFQDPNIANGLERKGIMPDIPRTLFPNYAKLQSDVQHIEYARDPNYGRLYM